jgi:CPA2 family monovalent cation:H+ antiporter-2
VLAETEYGKAIETVVEPFKGLLLGIFFFTVGMNIDFREFLRQPILLAAAVVCLIVAKSVILTALARLFRLSWRSSIETGLLLGPGGEFAFVVIGAAAAQGLVGPGVSSFTIALTSITMVLTPLLSTAARRAAPSDRSRADCPAAAWRDACNRGRLWPHRKSRVLAAQRARHNVYRRRP